MEYDHGPAGHCIRQRNKDFRRHLLKYHRAINEKELGDCHKQSPSPGEGHLREGLMPFSADSVCARIPPSQNQVHGPEVPGAHDVYPTIEYSHYMVHMEGMFSLIIRSI